jgi:hypothetical protein
MAITDISNVVISLQTTGVTRQGFGTPIFIDAHRSFEERVRAYNSLTAVAADFSTTSDAYKAAQRFYANNPAPRTIKIGRRLATAVVAPSGAVVEGTVYTVTVASGSENVVASYTASSADTATDVVEGLEAAIEGDVALAALLSLTVVGSTLTIDGASASTNFTVTAGSNITVSFTSTETPATIMNAIAEEDDDFYFVTAYDKTVSFITAMAADIEARKKIYFFSTSAILSYAALTSPANVADPLGLVKDSGYFRTAGMYAHNAADHPECQWVGYNATYPAGTVLWTNLVVSIPVALNADGKVLTATQQNNIQARRATFVRNEGGLNAIRGGLVAGGERIENIRGRDSLESEMKADITNLLLSQQGGKLPYTNVGLNSVRSVMNSVLDRFVGRNFINSNYIVTIPDVSAITSSKKQAGLLDDATFRAELTGAIELIDITGTLVLEL